MTVAFPGYKDDVLFIYLSTVWGAYECEICGASNWDMVRIDGYPSAGLPALNEALQMGVQSWPVMPVACTTCGNTKLLFINHVHNWATTDEAKETIANFKGAA